MQIGYFFGEALPCNDNTILILSPTHLLHLLKYYFIFLIFVLGWVKKKMRKKNEIVP